MKFLLAILTVVSVLSAPAIVINSDSSTRTIVTNTAIKRAGDRISGTFDAAGHTVFVSDVRFPDDTDITHAALRESASGANATYMTLPWAYISFTNTYLTYGGEYIYAADGFMYLFYDSALSAYAIYDTHPTNAVGSWYFTNVIGGSAVSGSYAVNAAESDVAGSLNLYSYLAATNAVTLSQSNGVFLVNGAPIDGDMSDEAVAVSNLTATGGAHINTGNTTQESYIKGYTDDSLLYIDAGFDRVGIGLSAPTEKLDVNGNIRARGDVIADGDMVAKGVLLIINGFGTNRIYRTNDKLIIE